MKINCTFFNFYGLFIILSIIIGIVYFDIILIKWKIKKIHLFIINALLFIFVTIFGLGLTIIENYIANHKFIIGFSSYGGLLGMITAIYLFSKILKYNKKHLYKILFITAPLMYSISKIGCLLTGCCYGIKYNGIGNIIYISSNGAPLNTPLFPIQLIESILFMLIFIYLNILYKKNKNIIPISLLLCGFSKFCLEFLRNSWKPLISFTQIISIIFIIIGFILLERNKKKYERKH